MFTLLMSPYIPSGLTCHFDNCHTWTDAAWNHWPYVSLPSKRNPVYIVFSDILVALCVYLYNIYTPNVSIYSQWPYVSL